MTDIADYLDEQRASFTETPLSDVDSLVLSTIAYFNFEAGTLGRTVPSERVALPKAICGISHHDLFGGIWLERMGGDRFLEALLASPRFMDLEIGYYANESSSHFEKQFAAVTFFLPDNAAYVAYRGTDNSLAGWKEDFNLTYMEALPSQTRARAYLEDIAGTGASRLYVGGHSKGGNLAEFAALTCRDQTFANIERIFNHDGPGFAFAPSDRISTPEYDAKLSKTVPGSSIFGMLMETRDNYRIIRSEGVLFVQHASTRWAIEDGDFVTLDSIGPEAAIITGTLNSWADLYEPVERELLIDAAYKVFLAANADTWGEFAQNPTGKALAIVEATTQLPANLRARILAMLRDIAPTMAAQAAQQARSIAPTIASQALKKVRPN